MPLLTTTGYTLTLHEPDFSTGIRKGTSNIPSKSSFTYTLALVIRSVSSPSSPESSILLLSCHSLTSIQEGSGLFFTHDERMNIVDNNRMNKRTINETICIDKYCNYCRYIFDISSRT